MEESSLPTPPFWKGNRQRIRTLVQGLFFSSWPTSGQHCFPPSPGARVCWWKAHRCPLGPRLQPGHSPLAHSSGSAALLFRYGCPAVFWQQQGARGLILSTTFCSPYPGPPAFTALSFCFQTPLNPLQSADLSLVWNRNVLPSGGHPKAACPLPPTTHSLAAPVSPQATSFLKGQSLCWSGGATQGKDVTLGSNLISPSPQRQLLHPHLASFGSGRRIPN